MADHERVGTAHDGLTDLLRAIEPEVLIRLVAAAAGIEIGEIVAVSERDPRVQIPALQRRGSTKIVDFIYTVQTKDGKTIAIWLFEVELSWDWKKRRRWSLYLVAFENELDADGHVVVFTPDPELRERIRTNILPRSRVQPILIEPDHIERITDYDEARRRPELTILSCLFHAQEPARFEDRVAVFRAAVVAIQSLDELRAWRYASTVMSLVSKDVIKQGLDEIVAAWDIPKSEWPELSNLERKGFSFNWGLEEGRKEGLEEGQREACGVVRRMLVDVLELRGWVLTHDQRARIEACESLELLQRWYAAIQASSPEHPLDELLA